MKVAVLFHHIGPYHHARLNAAARLMEVVGIEWSAKDNFGWGDSEALPTYRKVSLFSAALPSENKDESLSARVESELKVSRLDVAVINGWNDFGSLHSMQCCVKLGIPMVVMSESTAWDDRRVPWKEWIKRQLIGLCSAGLAGGSPHGDYLEQLGMLRHRIFIGYDVVDNGYFEDTTAEIRTQKSVVRRPSSTVRLLPSRLFSHSAFPNVPYFLASARFIEKKNLPRLLKAYHRYRHLAEESEIGSRKSEIWDLILLGDGPLRPHLCHLIADLGLDSCVHLPGFKQYPELPAYYAHAGAFIHASTTEQWGLVVNEAMASGLPVLVSNRCGCAHDLVKDSVNGFTFDPFNVEQLAQHMLKLSTMPASQRSTLAQASQRIISQWGPDRFATGLQSAAECAVRVGSVRPTLAQRMILKVLLAR